MAAIRQAGRWACGTALLAAVIVAMLVLLPSLFGWQRYAIVSGSMTGTYDRGTLVLDEVVPVADLKVGDVIDGTVTKLVNFGAFVRVRDGLEGLIHISELSNQRVAHPGDVVHEGQSLKLRIISLDSERHRLGLSLKQAEEGAAARPVVEPSPMTDGAAAPRAERPERAERGDRRPRPDRERPRPYSASDAVQEPEGGIDTTLAAAFAGVREQIAAAEAAEEPEAEAKPPTKAETAKAAKAAAAAAAAEAEAQTAEPEAAPAAPEPAAEAPAPAAEEPAAVAETAPATEPAPEVETPEPAPAAAEEAPAPEAVAAPEAPAAEAEPDAAATPEAAPAADEDAKA